MRRNTAKEDIEDIALVYISVLSYHGPICITRINRLAWTVRQKKQGTHLCQAQVILLELGRSPLNCDGIPVYNSIVVHHWLALERQVSIS